MKKLLTILFLFTNVAFSQICKINGRFRAKDTTTNVSDTLHGSLVSNFFTAYTDTVQNLFWKQMFPTYQWRQVGGSPAGIDTTNMTRWNVIYIDSGRKEYPRTYWQSTSPDLRIYNLQQGTYKFELMLTMWDIYRTACTGFDTITLTVVPAHALALSDSSNVIVYHPDKPKFFVVNPAKNVLELSIPSDYSQKIDLSLYDIQGRLLLSKQLLLQKGKNDCRINVSNLATGDYILKLTNKYGISNNKKLFVINEKP